MKLISGWFGPCAPDSSGKGLRFPAIVSVRYCRDSQTGSVGLVAMETPQFEDAYVRGHLREIRLFFCAGRFTLATLEKLKGLKRNTPSHCWRMAGYLLSFVFSFICSSVMLHRRWTRVSGSKSSADNALFTRRPVLTRAGETIIHLRRG